jgi:hypothetical protein
MPLSDRSYKVVKVTILLSAARKIIPLGVFNVYVIYLANFVGLSHTPLVRRVTDKSGKLYMISAANTEICVLKLL